MADPELKDLLPTSPVTQGTFALFLGRWIKWYWLCEDLLNRWRSEYCREYFSSLDPSDTKEADRYNQLPLCECGRKNDEFADQVAVLSYITSVDPQDNNESVYRKQSTYGFTC